MAGDGGEEEDFAAGGGGEAVLGLGGGGEFGFADGDDFGALREAVAVVDGCGVWEVELLHATKHRRHLRERGAAAPGAA